MTPVVTPPTPKVITPVGTSGADLNIKVMGKLLRFDAINNANHYLIKLEYGVNNIDYLHRNSNDINISDLTDPSNFGKKVNISISGFNTNGVPIDYFDGAEQLKVIPNIIWGKELDYDITDKPYPISLFAISPDFNIAVDNKNVVTWRADNDATHYLLKFEVANGVIVGGASNTNSFDADSIFSNFKGQKVKISISPFNENGTTMPTDDIGIQNMLQSIQNAEYSDTFDYTIP